VAIIASRSVVQTVLVRYLPFCGPSLGRAFILGLVSGQRIDHIL
jgi:hypothetical protein